MTRPVRVRLDASRLRLDPSEAAARLRIPKESVSGGAVSEALERLLPHVSPVFSYVTAPVCIDGDSIDAGFGPFVSSSLSARLSGCPECAVAALTLGAGTDRYLSKLSLTSPSEHFVADALASALAEAAADEAERIILAGRRTPGRFSPGYGDFPLSFQPAVLALTDAGRLSGITVSPSLLMSPMKSITAVIGFLPE
ncbi:MAG: hypothetical protein ILO42_09290 [Clostridia bacterium]|nr:hypothetical protein [Clostridia bacterium]MBP5271136.1 hypothetical protein [Clostridia bacterium]